MQFLTWRAAARWLAASAALTFAATASAQSPAQGAASMEAEMKAASEAARNTQVLGPADIKLRDQGLLKLPADYVWIPEPAASQLMHAMGNHPDSRQLGLVFPTGQASWLVVAQYEPSGYIKDDDARDWKVDEMFQSLKDGTEAANRDRSQRGFPELEILGWVQKPSYDPQTHQLVWSMSARHKQKEKGEAPADGDATSINYNTYALGREGYISMNLITDLKDIEKDKAHASALLAALSFSDGKRYADFNASTDHLAEYGLAALVGGVVVKKLGLFAVMAAFFLKFAKVILLGGIAALAAVGKFVGRKKDAGAGPPQDG
jgi:uncharacterized membrane-anchored protein